MSTDGNVAALHSLTRAECLDLLPTVPLGRIAGIADGQLFVLPVNFAMLDNDILIRTNPGTKLDAAIAGADVAFEVDHFVNDGMDGWSVLVRAPAHEITAESELAMAREIPLRTFAAPDQLHRFIRISTSEITGRRFNRM